MVLSRDDVDDKAKERHRSEFEKIESEIDASLGRVDPDRLNEYSPLRVEYKEHMSQFVRKWLKEEYEAAGWVISIYIEQDAPDNDWTIELY